MYNQFLIKPRSKVVHLIDTNDFVIVDRVKYKGTPGLYQLIFKRILDDTIYTENDKLVYKSILLATNAQRRIKRIIHIG